VFHFQNIVQVRSNICPICEQASELIPYKMYIFRIFFYISKTNSRTTLFCNLLIIEWPS